MTMTTIQDPELRDHVAYLWREYWRADRTMARYASHTDERGMDLFDEARDTAFECRAELEGLGAWR